MIRRYWKFLVPAMMAVGVLVVLLFNLSSNLVYFHTPTELNTEVAPSSDRLRLGGQVVAGSVVDSEDTLLLTVTDGRESADIQHTGVVRGTKRCAKIRPGVRQAPEYGSLYSSSHRPRFPTFRPGWAEVDRRLA